MAIRYDNYWIRYYFTLAAFASCVTPGCASKQDMDSLQSRVNSLSREVEELKQKNKRLLEFEKLKAAREQKVDALNDIADKLTAARAWKSEAEAYKAHRKANAERRDLLASRMQSPDRARSIGPTEGHEPYAGSYQHTYVSLLPVVKAEVYELLDKSLDYKESEQILYDISVQIHNLVRDAKRALDLGSDSFGQRVTYPGLSSDSLEEVFRSLIEVKFATRESNCGYGEIIRNGPTRLELTKVDLR